MRILIVMLAALLGAGCATTDSRNYGTPIDSSAKWVMLPILNHTDVPQFARPDSNVASSVCG